MKILIVDDDKSSRELLSELVKTNGHTTITAGDGATALELIQDVVPDLIISDILMPGMDGFEFCQRIRADDRLSAIPFVLLSGAFLEKKDSEFARSIGVSHFLAKPIDPADFLQVVEALLINRKKMTRTTAKSSEKKDARIAEDKAKLVTNKLYQKVLELDEEKSSSRERENQLRVISNSLPELIAEIDTNYRYVFVNDTYAQACGKTWKSIIGASVWDIAGDTIFKILRPKLDIAAGGSEHSSILTLPIRNENRARRVVARFVPRSDLDGNIISAVVIFSDITHLHQVESALNERESMLNTVLGAAPIILFAVNREGILEVSEGENLEAIGYAPGQGVGLSVFDAFKNVPDILQDLVIAMKGQKFETTISLADRFLKMSYTPQLDAEGNFIGTIGVAVDETVQRSLEKEVMRVSDTERERISQDLHDSLGQTLTGVNLLCQALQKKLSDKSLLEAADAKKIGDLAAYATRVAKQAIQGLSPVSRMESGLALALEDLTRTTEEIHKVPCSFLYTSDISLPDHQSETQVYRILQEAINNAVKHADPSKIDVSYRKNGDKHQFVVQDVSGKGNGTERKARAKNGTGMGLSIMRYRSTLIGASLNIEHNESGTCVTCSI